jgi:uncharacterized membrane protein
MKDERMIQRKIKGKITSNTTIVLAIILLLGVLAMLYGYFGKSMHWTNLGLFITIGGSYTLLFHSIIFAHIPKRASKSKQIKHIA